jgi:hypothetical protein
VSPDVDPDHTVMPARSRATPDYNYEGADVEPYEPYCKSVRSINAYARSELELESFLIHSGD